MKTISVINQKGGVGKTTTALAMGAWLHHKGHKVLFVDLDPQGNMTLALNGENKGYNSLNALQDGEVKKENIQLTTPTFLNLIPSNPMLAVADSALNQTGKEYRLREALGSIAEHYDYAVIDTPPSLSIVTINALTASDYVVIPAQADIFSLQGITQLGDTLEAVRKYTNPNLNVLGIVFTKHNARSVLSRDLQQVITDTALHIHTKAYTTFIREAVAVREAQATKTDLFTYDKKNNASKDYDALMQEIYKEINP